jgi:hypothetical protein
MKKKLTIKQKAYKFASIVKKAQKKFPHQIKKQSAYISKKGKRFLK